MIRVLVVDDDKDFLRVVTRVLEGAGYSAMVALDAMDALEKLQQERYDLVLSDANMPGPSGFDLVKTIRKHSRHANITVALLTGRRDKKDVYYGIECGADDYIVKPIDPDLFLSKVQALVDKRFYDNTPEVTFAESEINVEAKIENLCRIKALSEKGMLLTGPVAFANNFKMVMASPLFGLIGIAPPRLRVLRSDKDKSNPQNFTTEVSFVGLNEGELQKIRYWVNTQIIANKEEKAS